MKERICPHKRLKILFDYGSSSVWCASKRCGCNLEHPDIPENIMELITEWAAVIKDTIDFEERVGFTQASLKNLNFNINKLGKRLAKSISRFTPCRYEKIKIEEIAKKKGQFLS